MKRLAFALLVLTSLVSAKPAFLPVPLAYETLTPAGQIGANGPLDNSEVAASRAQHALDDRANLSANEAPHRSQVQPLRPRQSFSHVVNNGPATLTLSAPLGADGRVVDTAEVAAAKVAHAAAHANERLNLASEAARSRAAGASDSSEIADDSSAFAADSRILDAPGVAGVHVNEKINLAGESVRREASDDALTRIGNDGDALVPLVLSNGVVITALVPVNSVGRLPDSPGVSANGNRHPANDVKTVDALAVAGPALAYGRLVY